MKKLLLIYILMFATWLPAYADIITVTGNAPIINNNIAEARNKAIKDALNQALLQTGANISYEQELSNGALTRDNFKIKSSSNIKSYNVIKQEQHSDYLSVTVRANIIPKQNACKSSHSKTITAIKFIYDEDQLAQSQRGLYGINKEITRQFYGRLLQNDRIFNTKAWIDANYKLDLRTATGRELSRNLRQQLIQLAHRIDTQYLLLGSIRDVSFADADGNMLTKWFNNPNRNISFSVYLVDGFKGDVIFAKNYQGVANWDLSESNDVKSNNFWKSSFGKTLNQMISNSVADLTREIQCQNLNTRIIRVDRNEYYIDAGANNNIKVGDHFTIALNNSFNDSLKNYRLSSNSVEGDFVVTRVFDNTAVLKISKGIADTNIQIGDLATAR